MIGEVSNNTLLAALFGPGIVRVAGVQTKRDPAKGSQINKIDTEGDRVELSRAARLTSGKDSKNDVGQVSALGDPEQQDVQKLKKRDAEVRRHEAAHKSAAGQYASGGATFDYQAGPNGKQYAVGGEVSIDTSEIAGDPNATIRKMQQVRRAALAPANPSGQDRAVAAAAARLEQQARTEISEKKRNGKSQQNSPASPYSETEATSEASRGLLMSVLA